LLILNRLLKIKNENSEALYFKLLFNQIYLNGYEAADFYLEKLPHKKELDIVKYYLQVAKEKSMLKKGETSKNLEEKIRLLDGVKVEENIKNLKSSLLAYVRDDLQTSRNYLNKINLTGLLKKSRLFLPLYTDL